MLELLIPERVTRVVVYLHPISMRWGATKLRAFCTEELGLAPDNTTAFVFSNKAKDALLMYSQDFDGDSVMQKRLALGAFLLPAAPEHGRPYSIMRPEMLSRLFRSEGNPRARGRH